MELRKYVILSSVELMQEEQEAMLKTLSRERINGCPRITTIVDTKQTVEIPDFSPTSLVELKDL